MTIDDGSAVALSTVPPGWYVESYPGPTIPAVGPSGSSAVFVLQADGPPSTPKVGVTLLTDPDASALRLPGRRSTRRGRLVVIDPRRVIHATGFAKLVHVPDQVVAAYDVALDAHHLVEVSGPPADLAMVVRIGDELREAR